LDQVANGVAVRMAVLYLLAGGSRDGFGQEEKMKDDGPAGKEKKERKGNKG